MRIECVKGRTRATSVEVTGVPQHAFDLAMAKGKNDRECVLLRLLMPKANQSRGGMMTLESAEGLANGILEIIEGLRKGQHAFEGAA